MVGTTHKTMSGAGAASAAAWAGATGTSSKLPTAPVGSTLRAVRVAARVEHRPDVAVSPERRAVGADARVLADERRDVEAISGRDADAGLRESEYAREAVTHFAGGHAVEALAAL